MSLAFWAVLLGLVGLLVAALGVALIVSTTRFAFVATASARGRVIGHDLEDSEDATYYYPRIAFEAAGTEWIIRGKFGHMRPTPRLGAQVRVFFPPSDPAAAELGRFGGVAVSSAILLLGVGLMASAAVELVWNQSW